MGRRILLILAVGLLALGVAGGALWLRSIPGRLFARLGETMAARYHDEVRMFLELNKLVEHGQLVVTELDNVVMGEYANGKEWLGLDLGTTTLTYSVPVKFYYAVSLAGEAPFSFAFDAAKHSLTVEFEPLALFSLEPDLGKIDQTIDVGWARSERFSGAEVKRRFKAHVMSDLRKRGEALELLAIVREPARKRLEELVRVFLRQAHPTEAASVKTIHIRFRGEPEPKVVTVPLR